MNQCVHRGREEATPTSPSPNFRTPSEAIRRRGRGVSAAVLGLMILVSGCSYSREWKAASRQPATDTDLTGAWVGTWQNSNNSHKDQLKAILTRVSDTEYEAYFKAWWFGVFSGTFHTTLFGHWEGNEFVFQGTQDVLGLEFKHRGRATATNFVSSYSSADYQGRFVLQRPTGE